MKISAKHDQSVQEKSLQIMQNIWVAYFQAKWASAEHDIQWQWLLISRISLLYWTLILECLDDKINL